ncbi:hypothetical protein [Thiomicrorhabdus sp. Kp2]|uniref:hypothetical protein n=1 Tax=Thiomicrorhabdus sp. Kp2 TaxID=1123518 RepID=UPI0004197ED3|nr:hypothetical protein [Thiomicrorhabdus sp. Kp2]
MNTQTQKTVLKTLAATALVTATFATMAMDMTNTQAQQEMALHAQEKVQTMTQNMEKIQAMTQIMEHTQSMNQSMEQAQNRVRAQLEIDTSNTEVTTAEDVSIETEANVTETTVTE